MATIHRRDLEDQIALFLVEQLPETHMCTVLDVGSNVGWWTYQFAQGFPQAEYHLFEPVRSLADESIANLARFDHITMDRVHVNRVALSSSEGVGRVTTLPDVTVNHLVEAGSDWPVEDVDLVTGDGYCHEHGIDHVDYLKIDCEGHDLEVLQGFSEMIDRGRVAYIQVEVSLSPAAPTSHFLQPLATVEALLRPRGYELFKVINQCSDDLPYLARADVVFVLRSVAEAYPD